MAVHTKRFKVGDDEYETTHFLMDKGLRLGVRIGEIAGEPLALMAAGGLDAKVDGELIGAVIKALFKNLDQDEVSSLVKDLFSTTLVVEDGNRNPIKMDTYFAGRLGHMSKVLLEIVKFQFSDFLAELVGAGEVLRSETKPVSKITAKANSKE